MRPVVGAPPPSVRGVPASLNSVLGTPPVELTAIQGAFQAPNKKSAVQRMSKGSDEEKGDMLKSLTAEQMQELELVAESGRQAERSC